MNASAGAPDAAGSDAARSDAAGPDAAGVAEQPDRRFASTRRLLGSAAMQRLSRAHVVVVGVGGVGSWAAEALVRSGVGRLTLIDLDQVVESNINRQLHALESTIGLAKVDAMAARLAQIAPLAQIRPIEQFVEADSVATVMPADAEVVVDAIDQVAAKAALIAWCVAAGVPVITCGAAGGRTDPLQLATTDLARTRGDALLASVRSRLRRLHGFPPATGASAAAQAKAPPFGVLAIHSTEPSAAGAAPDPATGRPGAPLACAGYGSIVTVTATMGMAAAARAIAALVAQAGPSSPPQAGS